MPTITHHGAVTGVTGSCHQYTHNQTSVLIDCGLFQGAESNRPLNEFNFPIDQINALIVTHCHIDHVGRIPWLIAAGYQGPIYCTEPTAKLLPLVLEDALGIHIPNDQALVERAITRIQNQIHPIPYNEWHPLPQTTEPCGSARRARQEAPEAAAQSNTTINLRFQPAGHIMGSAYVELDADGHSTVFSGDLGAPGAVFVDEPQAPEQADILVLESTYGDKNHEHRATRKTELTQAIQRSLTDGGTILIPAFSLGRTQELLAFIEEILHENKIDPLSLTLSQRERGQFNSLSRREKEQFNSLSQRERAQSDSLSQRERAQSDSLSPWAVRRFGRAGERVKPISSSLPIILDSPLAQTLTTAYRSLQPHWRQTLQQRRETGRYPLAFDNLITIENHREHLKLVNRLAKTGQPAIVLAASGMCQGGRIVNYLQALIDKPETDILFVGYQARGTLGRTIQQAKPGERINLFGETRPVNARIHRISGFSAHADQTGLINFATGIPKPPKEIRLIHGDPTAKQTLQQKLTKALPTTKTHIPTA